MMRTLWKKLLAPRTAHRTRPCAAARWPRAFRPILERLESRDTPALALTYGGPGTALTLAEVGAAAADNVTISEAVAGTLRIDLNGAFFDPTSTAAATGLTYQNAGSPGTSTFATVDISAANAVTVLSANLGGLNDLLALGMANAAGGVRAVFIDGQAGADAVTLNATTLGVGGVGGTLTVSAEALAVAAAVNTSAGAAGNVTLNVDDIDIPATGTINAGARTVTIQPQSTARAIDLGTNTPNTLGLTSLEVNRITAGQLIIGDPTNTGDITVSSQIAPTGTAVLTLRTAGSILDGTATEQADLTVATLTLQGGARIGNTAGDRLDIDATTLNASTAGAVGNDIFLEDRAGGVAVGLVTAGAGNVVLLSGGNSLTSVTPNDNVAEVVGNVVTLLAAGASNGATGQIGFFTTAAQFFEVDAVRLNASTNNSRLWILDVAGGVAIATINAGTETAFVRVNAGVMTSATVDGAADIIAANINLRGVGGGSLGTSAASPLEVDATTGTLNAAADGTGTLNIRDAAGGVAVALAQTANGAINLEAAGAAATMTLTTLTAPGNTVSLRATGAINGTPGGTADVTALSLALRAGAGIGVAAPLETSVSNLAFQNVANAVNITNSGTGTLTIASVDGLTASTNTGTTTTLTDASPLIFAVNTTSAGTLTGTATDTAAAGDDLTVNAGVTVRSTGADVILRAGDNLTLGAGSLVQAATTIALAVDFGNADAGVGGTATFAGASLNALGGASVVGGPDNDTFNVSSSPTTNIAIDGGLGIDTLNFDAQNNSVTITPNSLTGDALRPVTFTNVEVITIANNTSTIVNGTAGNDTFVLSAGPGGPQVSVNGGSAIGIGNAPLTINGLGGADAATIDFGAGNPVPTGGVTFTGAFAYTVLGTNGNDRLILQQAGGVSQFSLNGSAFVNIPGATTFQFNGLAGNDTMRVLYAGGDPVPPGGVVFDGGIGTDQLGVFGGNTGLTANYNPSATTPGNGTVTVNGRVITFQNLLPVDITGMAVVNVLFPNGDDAVTVQNGFDFTVTGAIPALQVSGTSGGVAFETVALWNNTTVNINTTTVDGNDTVTIASANNAHNNANINITTGAGTDTVTFNGATSLTGTLAVTSQTINVNAPIASTSAAGGVTFTNTGTLTINNTTITSQGPVIQNGAGPVTLTGDVAVTTNTGAITFQSPITATSGTDQFTSTGGGAVTFAGTYNGPAAVTVTTGGLTTFAAAVGNTTALASLTTDGGGTTAINGGQVRTVDAQTYTDDVTLGAAATLFTSVNGPVTLGGTLSGASAVTVTAPDTTFGGAVNVASLTTGGGGVTAVNGPSVTTTGAQTYNDAVTVGGPDTLFISTGNLAIAFNSTLDGASNVTVTTAGATTFADAVGDITPLTSLTTNGGGPTAVNGPLVATTNAQTYDDAVTVAGPDTLFTSASGPVTFNSTLTGASNVTVTAPSVTTFAAAVNVGTLTTDGGGTTAVNGPSVTTTGVQVYSDAVTLGAANTLFISTGNDDITFASSLSGASAVTVTTAGQTTFGGAVSVNSLLTNGGGATAVNGPSVTTAMTQTYNDAVTVGGPTTVFASTGSAAITFGSTLDGASAVTVNTGGATTFTGAVGSNTPLTSLATDAGGTTAVNGGFVSTAGAQSYGDAVTLGAAATLFTSTAGPVTFASTLTGASAVTVTSPGTTTFAAAVNVGSLTTNGGGTTAVNGPSVTTATTQTYVDAVTVGGPTTLFTSTGNAAINFNSTLTGPSAVTVTTSGTTTFGGAVNVNALTTDGGGLTLVNGPSVTTATTQTYNDAVTVGGPTTLFNSTGNGAIFFGSSLNGPSAVTVTTGGLTTFTAAVSVASLLTDGGGTTAVNGPSITTALTQTYNDAVTVAGPTTLFTSTGNGAISFNSTLNGPSTVTVTTGGTTTFGGAVGTTPLISLTTNGGGTTAINGGAVTTAMFQTYTDDVTLGAAAGVTTLDTTNNGAASGSNLTFGGTLNGSGAAGSQCLAIRAGTTGNVFFTGAVGASVALGDTVVASARDVTFAAALTATDFRQAAGAGTTRFNGTATLSAAVALDVTALGIILNANVNATNSASAARLNGQAAGVTQVSGVLIARNLLLNGTGPFNFPSAGNDVGTLAAMVNGPVNYQDANDLIVGQVTVAAVNACGVATTGGSATGIHTGASDINLTISRNFTATNPNTTTLLLDAGGAAGGFVTVNIGPAGTATFNAEASARRATFNGSITAEGTVGEAFSIRPSVTTPITVNGNLPVTQPGDSLAVFLDATVNDIVFTPLPGQGNGMFTFTANSRQTLNFTSIERLVQANQGALLGLVAFAEQTGPRPQDFVLSVQGQVAGNVNPVAVAPVAPAANTFIVSPARVNPVALVSAPELAVADVNGDAVPDLIVASGSGSSPLITVVDGTFLFSGVSNLPAQAIIAQFFAYDPNFLGGVFVAAADLNGDGRAEIITGAGAGGGPHVKVFTINPNAPAGSRVQPFPGPLGSFFAYDPNFGGGVRVAAGNVTAAGPPDIVTAAGPGGGPHVKVFDGATGATVRSFFAYDPTFTGGVFVAVSSSVGNSDYDRDGFADILTGPGFGGGPHVKIFSGQNLAVLTSFMAFGQPGGGLFPSTFASGVGGVSFFVDEADDGFADDVLVTTGRTRGALALVFRDKPVGQPLGPTPDKTLVNDPQFIDGLIPGLLTF